MTTPHNIDAVSERAVLAAYALALGCALYPVVAFAYPPLVDYPNHLARLHILLEDGNAVLARYYAVQWRFVPNLALDLFAVACGWMGMGAAAAGKAFVLLTMVVQTGGVLAVSRALFGRVSPWAVAGVLFVFNYALHLGMVGFLFASGLALWAFAVHLSLLGKSRAVAFVVEALMAAVLLVAHLYGFAIYGVLVGVHALSQAGWNVRELARRAAPFVPALVVFWALSPTAGGPTFIKMPDPLLKLIHLAHLSLFDGGSVRAAALVLVGGFAALFAFKRRTLFAPHMGWVVLAFLGLYVVLPHVVLSSGNADWRLLTPLALIVCAALAVPLGRKAGLGGLALVVALSAVQAALVYDRWRLAEAHQRHMMAALGELPRGARVFSAVFGGGYADAQSPVPWTHMAALGVVANDHFVPSVFANPTQQPLAYVGEFEPLRQKVRRIVYDDPAKVDWDTVKAHFDYIVLMDSAPGVARWLVHVPFAVETVDAHDPHIWIGRIAQ